MKALVALAWVMDAAQTLCIVISSYQYTIYNFSRPEIADYIFGTVAADVVFTAVTTIIVNGYFVHRVHMLSQRNWWLTAPTALCLVNRLVLALISGIEMLRLRSFDLYRDRFGSLLTAGLSLSAFTDVVITGGLCYYLRTLNRGVWLCQTKKTLSRIVSFADNNGAVTCVVALACLICWVVMPDNLVYLGLHFTIGKCYSNSLLATLNMRDYVKRTANTVLQVSNMIGPLPLDASASFPMMGRTRMQWSDLETCDEGQSRTGAAGQLEIKIDSMRTVHFE